MRYYNLKVLALLISFFVGTVAIAAHFYLIAISSGVVGVVLLISVISVQGEIARANSAFIKKSYDAFEASLRTAQASAARDLQGADEATVNAVTAKLVEAGKYMGSNPVWRTSRRIITSSDIAGWYDEGKKVADAALALIEAYKKSRQA
jgi:hypothetical protein